MPLSATAAPRSARARTTRSQWGTSTSSAGPPSVFDHVIVGVVNQPVRKSKTLFTAEERVAFIADGHGGTGQCAGKTL